MTAASVRSGGAAMPPVAKRGGAAVDLVRGASEIADVHVRVVLGDADVKVGEVLQQCPVCAYVRVIRSASYGGAR